MADVYTYVNNTGTIVPDANEINAQVITEYQDTFGADLNTDPSTPQGMLITLETASRIAVADNNAQLANQFNPNLAGGVYLDALLALLGSFRTPATHSTVACTLSGVAGTSIPAGAQISNADGSIVYQLTTTTVIPFNGSITDVAFQSVNSGAIPGDAETLNVIVSNILGWETVTNPTAATLGVPTQSDVSARLYRLNTLARQGTGLAQAITSALYTTGGVTSLTFQENATSSSATINNVPMVANSIYACVAGTATLDAIAETLTNTKSGGCAYNNGLGIPQSVNVTNAYSGQVIPVLFDLPSQLTVAIRVTVNVFGNVGDVQQIIRDAIMSYVGGGIPGEAGFVVGASVSPFQIAGAINILVPGVFVQEVEVAVSSFTQIGTLTASSANVTDMTYNSAIATSMIISGDNIPSATTVSSLSGSTGLVMSASATAAATDELLTFAPPSLSYQTTEIPIEVFQQAIAIPGLITVITS